MDEDEEVTVDSLRDADILPDDVLDKHLAGSPDAPDDDDSPEPESDDDDDPLDDDDDDTPEEGIEDDESEEDTDDDADDGDDDDPDDDELDDDEEDPDEEEDDDGDDDDDEDEEDDVLETVTAKDHARIKKDPSLKKVHAQMQKAFTEKTTELATLRNQVERRDARITAFQEAVRTDEGMASFISATLNSNPEIIGMAFQALATSEDANPEAFLIEVGLETPEIFEAAWDRIQELQDDASELKRHKRDRARDTREAALDARERRGRHDTFDRDMTRVEGAAQKEARRLKIHPDDMDELNDRIKAKVRESLNKDNGSIELTNAEVREVVKASKKSTDKALDRVRSRLEEEGVRTSRKKTKKRAAAGRRPKREKKGGPPRKKKRVKGFKPPELGDPLDAFVDHRMDSMGP